ncbi:hypothetical protein ACK31R_01175 [Aeromonas caviae]
MEPKTVVQTTGRPQADHWQAMQSNGFVRAPRWLSDDFLCDWPTLGERRAGRVNFVEIHRRNPAAGPWNVDIVRLLEQGGRW